MYKRALRGYEKVWELDYISTLSTINNLSILYADQGKLEEAKKIYKRVLRGYKKI
jgi:tetratricopeptide (TPR) repeat protein